MATIGTFDQVKEFNGKKFTGASIGFVHNWLYPDGQWTEEKIEPDKWSFRFTATKQRARAAPIGSGAGDGSKYHWLILADQTALKLDPNSYKTEMTGLKFKMGHKRPQWRTMSYNYAEQLSYRQSLINKLEAILQRLKAEEGMPLKLDRCSVIGL